MLLYEDHETIVSALAFSPNGERLASGSRDGPIVVRDALGNATSMEALPANPFKLHSLGFQTDDSLIAGFDGGFYLHNLNDRVSTGTLTMLRLASVAPFSMNRIALGIGERMSAAAGRFLLFDLASERGLQPEFLEPQGVKAVATCPANSIAAWSTGGRDLKVWDVRRQTPQSFRLSHSRRPALALAPDGSAVAAVQDWAVRVIDLGTKMERTVLKGHKGIVSCVAFSPDGSTIATGSWDQTVRLWDALSGSERAVFQWPVGKVFSLAYAPDGSRLAVGGDRGAVLVWDVE